MEKKIIGYKEKEVGVHMPIYEGDEKPLSEKVSELTSNTYVDGVFLKEDVAHAVKLFRKDMEDRLIFVDYYLKLRFGDLQ